MIWYGADIRDTSSCEALGNLLLANNIILYSFVFISIPYLIDSFNISSSKEIDLQNNEFRCLLFFIALVMFYEFIFMILLNTFTNDISYYGENCNDLLYFANVFFVFQYINELFESLYILGTIAKSNVSILFLFLWGIFFYFYTWIMGIMYLTYLGEGEPCGNLGDLFLANLIIFYVFLPFSLYGAYVFGPMNLLNFLLNELISRSFQK